MNVRTSWEIRPDVSVSAVAAVAISPIFLLCSSLEAATCFIARVKAAVP